jgi:NitT/TauT family transport system permease protein
VIQLLADPRIDGLLERALSWTLREAIGGYLIGVAIALSLSLLAVFVTPAKRGIYWLAAIVNGVPIIALGSVFAITLSHDQASIAVSSLATLFAVFVAMTAGLDAARRMHRDLFSAFGATRWTLFRRLEAPASLPFIADGLRVAAPAAILGAVIGEWFGSEHGIGPILLAAMQNYEMRLLWLAGLVTAAISLVAYSALGLAQHLAAERYS